MSHNYSVSPFSEENPSDEKVLLWEEVNLLDRHFFRTTKSGISIYVDPLTPYWFVPSPSMDRILREGFAKGHAADLITSLDEVEASLSRLFSLRSFLSSIKAPEPRPYYGRHHKQLYKLHELWFHITDECNQRCSHCLFSDRIGQSLRLELSTIKATVKHALPLGLGVVFLTGGEPLTHPDIASILEFLLDIESMRVGVLTNGLLYEKYSDRFDRLDKARLSFQISLDGSETTHDSVRGLGSFRLVMDSVSKIIRGGFGCSLAMSVNNDNFHALTDFIRIANHAGVGNVHFLWHLRAGVGRSILHPEEHRLLGCLCDAMDLADELGVSIDNVEAIRSQVFTHVGTRFDLGSAGWDSLAVGPDSCVYPSPATVGIKHLCAGELRQGLEDIWRESPVFGKIRSFSLDQIPDVSHDPLRLITGGADMDQILMNCDINCSSIHPEADPFHRIHGEIAIRVIGKEAEKLRTPANSGLLLRMGDIIYDCHADPDVNFCHSNCLLTLPGNRGGALVRSFYGQRADQPDETILNPVPLTHSDSELVPEFARKRMYGCGSPVSLAELQEGETVVDLGCGSGVEIFIACRKLGPGGLAVGVDMTPQMLNLAVAAAPEVQKTLGFGNSLFLMGMLEDIPLPDNFADVVISNCVINLTGNKRKVLSEVFRVLRPGGRMVISDVVSDTEPPIEIKTDPLLSGECLGGALRQEYLFTMIKDAGFCNSGIISRFPYRNVMDHRFFSLTFRAFKPSNPKTVTLMYKGPLDFVGVSQNPFLLLNKGEVREVGYYLEGNNGSWTEAGLAQLDNTDFSVLGQDEFLTCSCCVNDSTDTQLAERPLRLSGCVICGSQIVYSGTASQRNCEFCGELFYSLSACEQNHFVCDRCHSANPLTRINEYCLETSEKDMIGLLKTIRRVSFPLNGPEHHSLIPAIILTSYRNSGGILRTEDMFEAIRRGQTVKGGSCASLGVCGAAAGVGIAFSIILNATPLTPQERQSVMRAVSEATNATSLFAAARCCQRECYNCLRKASELSGSILGIHLPADQRLVCSQSLIQKECIKESCDLYPSRNRQAI